jgi:Beta xylosidase C-terminal Concanavalin A-like domain
VGTAYVNDKAEFYRHQIQKIIQSPEFIGRTRLAEFLSYTAEASLQGRTHLEQSELADRILHRGPNFNPLDDASVRKTATLIRQHLERYYGGSGAQDRIRVALPIRSYILQFHELDSTEQVESVEAVGVTSRLKLDSARFYIAEWLAGYRILWAVAGLVLAAAVSIFFLIERHPPAVIANPGWDLVTVRGDFMHGDLDLPGNAILTGPTVGDTDDVTVRMAFSPEHAVQQAGLLVFENADRYLKLGRQFLSRPALEFGMETQGRYQKPPNTFLYDADAQNGEPVWLSIRRDHSVFKAFRSANGIEWRHFGNTLAMPDSLANPRVAIFADHGRTNAPDTIARFDHLSSGLEFHDFPAGPTDLSQFVGWKLATTCSTGPGTTFRENSLAIRLGGGVGACTVVFGTPVPKGDWAISTRLDFLPSQSALAGLVVHGTKGVFRLIRWDLNGGAITAEYLSHWQSNFRDFEGSPAVILRIDCKRGVLYSSLSRDDIHYERLALTAPLSSLGNELEFGIEVARSSWFAEKDGPEAQFQYIHRLVTNLQNFQ